VLLAGLTTGHKIGLGVVGLVFIAFALLSAFAAPRRWPDFPGKHGLAPYVIACFVVFAAMLSAVMILARESEAKGAAKTTAAPAKTVQVQEKEFAILLPSTKLTAGRYAFVVKNVGKIQHDVAVQELSAKTPLISPGQSATLTVTLAKGTYTLYCTVPGHRAAGMVAKVTVS
jgi:uncharacterized cupredoxin-like copper-binding protein